jgi:beta-carotene 15,15'-dioxygenase
VFVGRPHGAADLAVSRRLCGWPTTLRLFVLYSALMGAVLWALVAAPVPTVLLFAGLSVWHFGVAHAHGQSPRIPTAWPWQAVAAVARGASVLGVPLAVWPAETSAHVANLWALVGRAGAPPPPPFEPAAVQMVGLCLTAAAVTALAIEAVASRHVPEAGHRTIDTLGDLVVIGALGVTADPLLAIGIYFVCWHAWREMSPLMRVIGPRASSGDAAPTGLARLASALAAVHVAALPLLVPTWAAIAAAWWLLSPSHSPRDLAVLSIAMYLVVTPSHEALGVILEAGGAARSRSMQQSPGREAPPVVRPGRPVPVSLSCRRRMHSGRARLHPSLGGTRHGCHDLRERPPRPPPPR